jgi:AraC family transcriptional regulator
MPAEISNTVYCRRIEKVYLYVESHFREDLTLDDLADAACFSKYHFHRIFTALTGETPADYLLRLRLEKAANQLDRNSGQTISDIAFDCGFSSLAFFSRVFKKQFGRSPSAFMKDSKNRQTSGKKGQHSERFQSYVADINSQQKDHSMRATIEQLPAKHIAAVTNYEGYNNTISKAFHKLLTWAGARGLLNDTTEYMGIGMDNPRITQPEKCRYKTCITIPGGFTADDGIETLDLPAGSYAVLYFEGKADEYSGAYSYLYGTFLPENGLVPGDSYGYEQYLRQPDPVPDPTYYCKICIPVKNM